MKKQLLSLVLALAMIMSLFAGMGITVSAAEIIPVNETIGLSEYTEGRYLVENLDDDEDAHWRYAYMTAAEGDAYLATLESSTVGSVVAPASSVKITSEFIPFAEHYNSDYDRLVLVKVLNPYSGDSSSTYVVQSYAYFTLGDEIDSIKVAVNEAVIPEMVPGQALATQDNPADFYNFMGNVISFVDGENPHLWLERSGVMNLVAKAPGGEWATVNPMNPIQAGYTYGVLVRASAYWEFFSSNAYYRAYFADRGAGVTLTCTNGDYNIVTADASLGDLSNTATEFAFIVELVTVPGQGGGEPTYIDNVDVEITFDEDFTFKVAKRGEFPWLDEIAFGTVNTPEGNVNYTVDFDEFGSWVVKVPEGKEEEYRDYMAYADGWAYVDEIPNYEMNANDQYGIEFYLDSEGDLVFGGDEKYKGTITTNYGKADAAWAYYDYLYVYLPIDIEVIEYIDSVKLEITLPENFVLEEGGEFPSLYDIDATVDAPEEDLGYTVYFDGCGSWVVKVPEGKEEEYSEYMSYIDGWAYVEYIPGYEINTTDQYGIEIYLDSYGSLEFGADGEKYKGTVTTNLGNANDAWAYEDYLYIYLPLDIEVIEKGGECEQHSYTYIPSGEEIHYGICGECGDEITEACTYGDDTICDKCGYDEIEVDITLPEFDFVEGSTTYPAHEGIVVTSKTEGVSVYTGYYDWVVKVTTETGFSPEDVAYYESYSCDGWVAVRSMEGYAINLDHTYALAVYLDGEAYGVFGANGEYQGEIVGNVVPDYAYVDYNYLYLYYIVSEPGDDEGDEGGEEEGGTPELGSITIDAYYSETFGKIEDGNTLPDLDSLLEMGAISAEVQDKGYNPIRIYAVDAKWYRASKADNYATIVEVEYDEVADTENNLYLIEVIVVSNPYLVDPDTFGLTSDGIHSGRDIYVNTNTGEWDYAIYEHQFFSWQTLEERNYFTVKFIPVAQGPDIPDGPIESDDVVVKLGEEWITRSGNTVTINVPNGEKYMLGIMNHADDEGNDLGHYREYYNGFIGQQITTPDNWEYVDNDCTVGIYGGEIDGDYVYVGIEGLSTSDGTPIVLNITEDQSIFLFHVSSTPFLEDMAGYKMYGILGVHAEAYLYDANLPTTHEHSFVYTPNSNNTHDGVCDCKQVSIFNQACTFVDGKCKKCGNSESATPPAHEHSYVYTSNDNGTHNGTCDCGKDSIANQTCTYVDGKCEKCEYSEPVAPPTVDIPVSNGENTVDAEAELSGNDAIIKPLDVEQIEQLVGGTKDSGNIVIDLTSLDKHIDTAGIPKSTLEAIINAAEDAENNTEHLIIMLSTAELKLDDTTMRAIVEQADGDVVKFNFDDVGLSRLNTAQTESIKNMDVRKGYEAYITVNDKRIGDFKGGNVEIIVPYAIPEGENVASFSVWYIAEDGTLEKQESTYDGKEKCFVVTHFSDYVIVYSAEETHTHNFTSGLENDANEHWNKCECGEEANRAAHADANNDGKCDACGYQMATVTPEDTDVETSVDTEADTSENVDEETSENSGNNGGNTTSDNENGCGTICIIAIIVIILLCIILYLVFKKENKDKKKAEKANS